MLYSQEEAEMFARFYRGGADHLKQAGQDQDTIASWTEALLRGMELVIARVGRAASATYPLDELYDPERLNYHEKPSRFEIDNLSSVVIAKSRKDEGLAVFAGWEKIRRLRQMGVPAVTGFCVPFQPLWQICATLVDITMFGRSPRWALRLHLALRGIEERTGVRIVRPIASELGIDKGRISRLYRPLPQAVVECLRNDPNADIWQVVELNDSQIQAWLDQQAAANVALLEEEALAERGPIAVDSPVAQLAQQHGVHTLLKQAFFKDPGAGAQQVHAFLNDLQAAGLISLEPQGRAA